MHQELKGREYYNGHIMNQSFQEWLKSCPKEYTWQMNQVTKDRRLVSIHNLTETERCSILIRVGQKTIFLVGQIKLDTF